MVCLEAKEIDQLTNDSSKIVKSHGDLYLEQLFSHLHNHPISCCIEVEVHALIAK